VLCRGVIHWELLAANSAENVPLPLELPGEFFLPCYAVLALGLGPALCRLCPPVCLSDTRQCYIRTANKTSVQLSILTLVRLCALLIGRERDVIARYAVPQRQLMLQLRVGLHHVAGRVADMPTRRQWSSRRFPKCWCLANAFYALSAKYLVLNGRKSWANDGFGYQNILANKLRQNFNDKF